MKIRLLIATFATKNIQLLLFLRNMYWLFTKKGLLIAMFATKNLVNLAV
jgi:hypothetical protein